MRASRLAVLVVIMAGMVSDVGHVLGQNKGTPSYTPRREAAPPRLATPSSYPYYSAASTAPASKPLAAEYPELVPLLLQSLEKVEDGMRGGLVVPALRRMGQSSLPPLVKVLEGKDPKQRAVALLCLSDLVGPDYPAREAIPAVMKLAKQSSEDETQAYALVVLTRLIAVNEPAPSDEKATACKGDPIFRGPLGWVRYLQPDGQIGKLELPATERGAMVSVYPDYLVVEGHRGLDKYTRYIKYKELLELTFMR